jgi:hypothetical protein
LLDPVKIPDQSPESAKKVRIQINNTTGRAKHSINRKQGILTKDSGKQILIAKEQEEKSGKHTEEIGI